MAAFSSPDVRTFTTASGTKTAVKTMATDDLPVVWVAHTGSTTDSLTDDNLDGLGTTPGYYKICTALKNSSGDRVSVFVRKSKIGVAGNGHGTTFTTAPGATSGGGLGVTVLTGMSLVDSAAVRQFKVLSNQTSNAIPSVTFDSISLTTNPVYGLVLHSLNSNAVFTIPSGWLNEQGETFYSTPATGLEVASDNSGTTATTVTWSAGTATQPFCALIIEFDASSSSTPVTVSATGVSSAGSAGTITAQGKAKVLPSGVSATGSSGNVGVVGKAIAALVGASSAGQAGSAALTGAASFAISGVSAAGQAGTSATSAKAVITLTGVNASGFAADVSIASDGSITVPLGGVAAACFAGDLIAVSSIAVLVSGVEGLGSAGLLQIMGQANVALSGAQAQALVGSLAVLADEILFQIPADRIIAFDAINRTITVAAEDRAITVDVVVRTVTIN